MNVHEISSEVLVRVASSAETFLRALIVLRAAGDNEEIVTRVGDNRADLEAHVQCLRGHCRKELERRNKQV